MLSESFAIVASMSPDISERILATEPDALVAAITDHANFTDLGLAYSTTPENAPFVTDVNSLVAGVTGVSPVLEPATTIHALQPAVAPDPSTALTLPSNTPEQGTVIHIPLSQSHLLHAFTQALTQAVASDPGTRQPEPILQVFIPPTSSLYTTPRGLRAMKATLPVSLPSTDSPSAQTSSQDNILLPTSLYLGMPHQVAPGTQSPTPLHDILQIPEVSQTLPPSHDPEDNFMDLIDSDDYFCPT
jgi:hypothetical protein